MKKYLLIIGILLFNSNNTWAQGKLCVLNFERNLHVYTQLVDKVFEDSDSTRVVHEAVPTDFLDCIKDDFEEIVMIVHSVRMTGNNPKAKAKVNLGYFRHMTDQEIDDLLELIESTIADWEECRIKGRKQCENYNELKKAGKQAKKELKAYNKLGRDNLYNLRLFMPHVFRKSLRVLASSDYYGLKKIRIATCQPKEIWKTYPQIPQFLEEFGVKLEYAPKDIVASIFIGHPVVKLTKRWLKKSLK